MPEKCSNKDGSGQKIFIIKWKWFIQDHATWELQRGVTHQQGASFRLGQTLELHEKLLDPTDTWTVPYEELWTERKRADWFVVHSECITSCLEGHSDQRQKKHISSVSWIVFFLAVMEELNGGKSPYVWLFHWLIGSGQWPGCMARQEGSANLTC